MTSAPTAESKKNLAQSRSFVLIAVAVVGLGFALFGEKGALRLHQVQQHRAQLAAHYEQLQQANTHLRNEIESLSHDERYMEQVARSTFNLVRDGEIIYQFSPSTH
nr:septum formation initiator family protein [uncultured Desulfuromonas sp.]